jgi:cbb3-type cytochrome oxidase subunit 1
MIKRFCDWLANTSLSQQFSSTDWFVPTIQTIHILAVSAAIVMFAMLNVRLLGITRRDLPLAELAGTFVPWIWHALLVLLATGILLTITEPARELLNNAFRLKMLLILALVILTAVLRSTLLRDPGFWTRSKRRQHLGQSLAIVSLILCVSIVSCGRLIAYV